MQEHNQNYNNDIVNCYQKIVESAKIQHDPTQMEVLNKLYKLQQDIEIHLIQKNSPFFKKIFSVQGENFRTKGMYIYGCVGGGKSMLMDLFFETSSVKKKRRVHFHAFMIEVHKALFYWRKNNRDNEKSSDPIPPIAKQFAQEADLLCFDEFQVTDIADAMILGRLFTHLFKNGVIVVATSNRPPDELYKDGLQRSRFLPFIKLLKQNVESVNLDTKKDYRLIHLKSLSTVYYTPLGQESSAFMEKTFLELTNNAEPEKRILEVGGRKIIISKTHADVAWASFTELCERPLGAADYIEIAREFNTILISDIPRLDMEWRNEAKRFVTLIDELYEHKVKLVCTAEVEPHELYVKGDGSFEFERTASRLIEMQSLEYIQEAHIS